MNPDRRTLEPARLRRAELAFTARRVALERARLLLSGNVGPLAGDLLLCRVVEPGHHKALQLAGGRPSTLFAGDELLLAAGGICGVVATRSERVGEPTRLEALGLLADASGRPLELGDFRIHPPPAARRLPTLAEVGTSTAAGGPRPQPTSCGASPLPAIGSVPPMW